MPSSKARWTARRASSRSVWPQREMKAPPIPRTLTSSPVRPRMRFSIAISSSVVLSRGRLLPPGGVFHDNDRLEGLLVGEETKCLSDLLERQDVAHEGP